MVIGVPKEIKNNENRISLTPAGVTALVNAGHTVLVEPSAGAGSGIADEEYAQAGALLAEDAADVYAHTEMIVKVKEPLEQEYEMLRPGQALFTYLHLAANRKLTDALLAREVTGIAYETVQLADGSLPLLAPMSEVAGRMSVQIGASLLQTYNGGAGVLLGGVPGVPPAEVVIIGGGTVGLNAAKIACGMGARVSVLDISQSKLAYIDDVFGGRVATLYSSAYRIAEMAQRADLLIGAVLVTGAKAPKLVTEGMVRSMKKGSVIVDVAIDQGGSVETIDRVTTHDHPCYEKFGVIHYSVANMPGAVPRTSTWALTGATLPYVLQLANKGVQAALDSTPALAKGLNTQGGRLTCPAVAAAFGMN